MRARVDCYFESTTASNNQEIWQLHHVDSTWTLLKCWTENHNNNNMIKRQTMQAFFIVLVIRFCLTYGYYKVISWFMLLPDPSQKIKSNIWFAVLIISCVFYGIPWKTIIVITHNWMLHAINMFLQVPSEEYCYT